MHSPTFVCERELVEIVFLTQKLSSRLPNVEEWNYLMIKGSNSNPNRVRILDSVVVVLWDLIRNRKQGLTNSVV
jgi:hypothetical protein